MAVYGHPWHYLANASNEVRKALSVVSKLPTAHADMDRLVQIQATLTEMKERAHAHLMSLPKEER